MKRFLLVLAAFVGSALMLTVIQPPFDFALLAWIAYVPFILLCSAENKCRGFYIISYVVSVFYWLGNLYWIGPVTYSGWVAFCLYTGLLWPLLAAGLRYCAVRKWPLFLAVPVLIVGAERLQGLFLGGFFWRHLSHSQYSNITLIQIADIFGAAGVSFLAAMVNGLAAEMIIAARQRRLFKAGPLLKAAIVFVVFLCVIFYGRFRIGEAEKFIEEGPVAAAVQPNVPQTVKDSPNLEEQQRLFEELLTESNESIAAGAELVVWPETMVPATLDERVLRVLDDSHSFKVFDERLRRHSKDSAFVLVGAYGARPKIDDYFSVRLAERYNSAFLYRPDGSKSVKQYNKIHLVPFGEVVPFKKSAPWLYNILMKFTPYDYDYSLDYGREYTVFEMNGGQSERGYKFGVMICYEDAIPKIARRFAAGKSIDWLVNISNDGWFVRFTGGEVSPSTELAQHTVSSVFRAVENRIAVLRSVNTGISCLIDTSGRVRDGFLSGTLPAGAFARQGVGGWFADTIPIDSRVSFFSKYGQWLDFSCAVCFIWLIIMPPLKKIYIRKRKSRNRIKSGINNAKDGN